MSEILLTTNLCSLIIILGTILISYFLNHEDLCKEDNQIKFKVDEDNILHMMLDLLTIVFVKIGAWLGFVIACNLIKLFNYIKRKSTVKPVNA